VLRGYRRRPGGRRCDRRNPPSPANPISLGHRRQWALDVTGPEGNDRGSFWRARRKLSARVTPTMSEPPTTAEMGSPAPLRHAPPSAALPSNSLPLVRRFLVSNHIRWRRRVCMTKCG
jgi:hypothetical protein